MVVRKIIWTIFIFILGLVVGMSASVSSGIDFGIDDEGEWFMFDRILPESVINTIEQHPAVIKTYVDNGDKTTQVWYDPSLISPKQINNYFGSLERQIQRNKDNSVNFPGYNIPLCLHDETLNQMVSIDVNNGEIVKVIGDPKC